MAQKMTLSAYLAQRGKKAKALTKGEAALLGIPFPLQSGWPRRYGAVEIDDQLLGRLVACAEASRLAAEEKAPQVRHKRTVGTVSSQQLEFIERTPALLRIVSGFVLRRPRRHRDRGHLPWI